MPYQPRATLDNPYGPQITFRTEDVLPPTAVYLSPEDSVVVWVMTDVAVVTIYLQLRVLMPTGEIKLIPYNFNPQFTYDWYPAFIVPPIEGYLLGAVCWAQNPQRGQCYVSVQLMRSAPPDLKAAGEVLLQGYINYLSVLSYPGSQIESTFSGRGAFLTITQPNQTGANLFFGAPQNTLYRFYVLNFSLITSAVAGNRTVLFILKDINNLQLGFWVANYLQPPTSTVYYSFCCGGAEVAASPFVTVQGPTELFIPPQSSLTTYINGMSATDQLQGIAAQVEEWMGQ